MEEIQRQREIALLNDLPELVRCIDKLNLSQLEKEAMRLDGIKARLHEYWSNVEKKSNMEEIKAGDINSYLLHKIGFSSGFTSDPQEQNPSRKFWLNDFELFMPNSTLYDYYYNDNGNMVRVETTKQLSDLYLSKTGNDLKIEL